MDCLFCKIINREIQSSIVYEDSEVTAFLDIDQTHVGHTLLVPKKHYTNMDDFNNEFNIMNKCSELVVQLKKEYAFSDYKIIINNGKHAGQEIFHLHIHIIPYY